MTASIRPIKASDVATVRTLLYSHLSPESKAEYLKINPTAATRTENILAGSDGVCLVADNAGELIAYLIGSTEAYPLSSIKYASLENIYVSPKFRRQGIGSVLFEQFKLWAESTGTTRLKVDVSPKNTAAIKFYEHQSFAPSTLTMESHF
ncbi:MAG: hypothetical protein NVSMB39_7160 [Candidatus Saccharimonadales bacterium]